MGLGWHVVARQRAVAGRLVHEMDVLSARRLVAIVLGRDVRGGVAGRDWPEPDGDSLPLRAFRGWAVPCPSEEPAPGRVVVAYRGERSPSPAKDSVLVLTAGGWLPADLVGRAGVEEPTCPRGLDFDMEIWTVDPPVDGLLLRVFERGSYHVEGGAVRYRRGGGGRQPLTPEVFLASSSLEGDGGRVLLRLVTDRAPWGGGERLVEVSLGSRSLPE